MTREEMHELFNAIAPTFKNIPENVPGFRADLSVLCASVERAKYVTIGQLSDVLSTNDAVKELGCLWLVSEVEGRDVQFNRLIGKIGMFDAPKPRIGRPPKTESSQIQALADHLNVSSRTDYFKAVDLRRPEDKG